MPEDEPDGKDDASKPGEMGKPSAEEQQQAAMVLAQMKSMFKGMKIAMAVEVEGSVVETNATHMDGSRVTIMELDFGKLLEMPEKLVQFSQIQPDSVEDAKAFMKDIPGFKVDMNKKLTIKLILATDPPSREASAGRPTQTRRGQGCCGSKKNACCKKILLFPKKPVVFVFNCKKPWLDGPGNRF